ncbi:MAG: BON domain-containing protein [Deltaproteobacteria bacterium]|nr:BON domain-containing protein [Deltaproteobacteria bacterium]
MSRVNKAFRRDNRSNGAYCYTAAPGVIVLHGTVFDTADRELAESTARQVRGVKQVINGLLTTTGDWQAEQARINNTLALNGYTDLTVRVIGSQAFLSDTAVGQSEQQRAIRVIHSVSTLQVVNFNRYVSGPLF